MSLKYNMACQSLDYSGGTYFLKPLTGNQADTLVDFTFCRYEAGHHPSSFVLSLVPFTQPFLSCSLQCMRSPFCTVSSPGPWASYEYKAVY